MSGHNSLLAIIKHVFIDIIGHRRKSFLIIYFCTLVAEKINYMIFSSFAIGISALMLSIIINIVLVYFYLSTDDLLPPQKLKQAISESFLKVLKVAIVNTAIIFIISTIALGISTQSGIDFKSINPIFALVLLFPIIAAMFFLIGITSSSIIHSIVEHSSVISSFKNGIETAKESFWSISKLLSAFIILAFISLGELFLVNFLSIILQISFISITIDSIKRRNAQ